MSRSNPRNAGTYDDIVRRTVVDPDSSVRPSREQERVAREGFRALDAEEQAIQDRVQRALAELGPGAAKVTCEVSRELVTLRGQVSEPAMLRRVEDAVAGLGGVETIHNQIVVAPA
jgi:osmotically-inducible protein OsmY